MKSFYNYDTAYKSHETPGHPDNELVSSKYPLNVRTLLFIYLYYLHVGEFDLF